MERRAGDEVDARDEQELRRRLERVSPRGGEERLRVFADWLESKGEPWGRLMALQLAGAEDPALERSLLAPHPVAEASWSRGFLRTVSLAPLSEPQRPLPAQRREAQEGLTSFFSLPAVSKLESLELLPWNGGDERVEALCNLPAGLLPATLRHLKVTGLHFVAQAVRSLLESGVLGQLRRLDLSQGDLGDAGVRELQSMSMSLSRLRELNLEQNQLSEAGVRRLRGALPKALLGDQRGPPSALPAADHGSDHREFMRLNQRPWGPAWGEDLDD